ncbi:MAG: hypothetical protein WA361_21075, partial [Candidatus Acidiferrales bacterium]
LGLIGLRDLSDFAASAACRLIFHHTLTNSTPTHPARIDARSRPPRYSPHSKAHPPVSSRPLTLAHNLHKTPLRVRYAARSRGSKFRTEDHMAAKKSKKSSGKKLKKVALKKVENLSVVKRDWVE